MGKKKLKNLATCKPSEFLPQTYKIKKRAEQWLTDTDILNIRKNLPVLEEIDPSAPEETREAVKKANKAATDKQGRENMSRIFDAIAGEHPQETMELLALCCFVEPEQIDEHETGDYLDALAEMMGHRATLSFFVSLVRLVRILTPEVFTP